MIPGAGHIEARLRLEPELDKLEANVMQALGRSVMRFLKASRLRAADLHHLVSGAALIAGVLAVVIFMWPELTPWYRPS
jgi:hypothetical protein